MQGPRRAVDQGRRKCRYGDDSHRAPNRALPAWPQHTQGPKYPWGDGVGGREKGRGVCRRGRRPPRAMPTLLPAMPCAPGTSWAQAHIHLMLRRSERYKRTTGEEILSGARGLALSHTRTCGPSPTGTLGCTVLSHHGGAGSVQGALYSSSQLHARLHASRQKPNGRRRRRKDLGWGCGWGH